MIKSISYSQEEILQGILHLYNEDQTFDCDCCYSTGNFYKKGIKIPQYCFDIEPKYKYVEKQDCRALPFSDNSIHSLIYDPPFLATTGLSLEKADKNNIINKRFGVYRNEKELFQFYYDSIKEFSRVLDDNGLLVIKIQDKVSSNKQYISHNIIINFCQKFNFYCEDLFVLLAKQRLVADWQVKHQKRARKFHSYFLVFRKGDSRLKKISVDTTPF